MLVRLPTDYTVVLRHRSRILDIFLPKNFIVTWNGTIWISKKQNLEEIPLYVLMREVAHMLQQEYFGPKEWLWRYVSSKSFRLQREIEAYTYELKYIVSPILREQVIEDASDIFSTHLLLKCVSTKEDFITAVNEQYTKEKVITNFTVKNSFYSN